MGEDGQAVVEERDLFFVPDDLELAVRRVPGLDQAEGLPGRLLGRKVESGQDRGQDDGRRQEDLPPAGLHRDEDQDRGRRADDGGSLPVRKPRNEHEVDDEPGRRRPGRFQDVDGRHAAAVGPGVEGERVPQGKAQEEAEQEGESQGGDEARQLGRQDAHELVREPQRDEPGKEENDGQAVEPGQSRFPAPGLSGA